MRLQGQTQTSMSLYRPPYVSFYAFTWDRPDNELRPVWLCLSCWSETRNSHTGLTLYWSHVNHNKSQTGSRNFKVVCFWSATNLLEITYCCILNWGTKHLVLVSCKQLQKFHTGTSSCWSEFVPTSCKYPLRGTELKERSYSSSLTIWTNTV